MDPSSDPLLALSFSIETQNRSNRGRSQSHSRACGQSHQQTAIRIIGDFNVLMAPS